MRLCHCHGLSAAVKAFSSSSSSSGEEHSVPLREGGSEYPEEGQLWGRWGGRELLTSPWSQSHLPERDMTLFSASLSKLSPPVEGCVTWLGWWSGHSWSCDPGDLTVWNCSRIRWTVRGTYTSIVTSGLQCQETRGASGLTGIKPQLLHLCGHRIVENSRQHVGWESYKSHYAGVEQPNKSPVKQNWTHNGTSCVDLVSMETTCLIAAAVMMETVICFGFKRPGGLIPVCSSSPHKVLDRWFCWSRQHHQQQAASGWKLSPLLFENKIY